MKILAAVDFSEISLRAAAVAQHWAKRLDAGLELVHVVNPPPGLPHELGEGLAVYSAALVVAGEKQLETLRKTIDPEGRTVTTKVLIGNADTELPDYASVTSASMLVLGTHGRSGAAHFFLGSTAERVVGHSKIPVLVVPQDALEGLADRANTDALEIVAALSAGAQGDAVVNWCKALRQRVDCNVTFVHVFDSAAEHQRLGIEGPFDDHGDDPELLSVLRRDLLPHTVLPGNGTTSLVLRPYWGKGSDLIAWEGATDSAHLLVLGVRGGKHLGSRNGAQTLRSATVPVMCIPTVPAAEVVVDTGIPRLGRVLVATDLSEVGNRSVRHAYQLVRGGGGRVEILHVVDVPIKEGGLTVDLEAELTARLRGLVPLEAELRGIHTRITVVRSDSAKESILQAAERIRPDAIVLSSHGRSGVARTVLGSVADAIIREATKPVVIVGPKAT
ncbi:MAG: universal stress protein [Deltaproteobacteria bacterium]|nr:universal stress protein [Deltaproteobacteria bacterium]